METVLDRFLYNVEKNPNRVCVWTDRGSFTYIEMKEYAMRVASTLKSKGISKGDTVMIELPRCREYFGIVFGAWMLGASCVPSDIAYPKDRRDYIAKDSGSKVRVTPELLECIEKDPIEDVYTDFQPSDLAMIIYTSGSTGRPKGVMHSHSAVVDSAERTMIEVGIGDEDLFAGLAAFTFVAGFMLFQTCSYCGIPYYVVPDEARVNLVKLSDFIADHGITLTFMAPAMANYIKNKKKTLRKVIIGGERASNVYSSDFEMINIYGSTETCGHILSFRIDRPYDSTPLGTATKNLYAHILDDDDNETDEGELCIAGNVSLGYRNLPEATAKAFIPNPFADKGEPERMYRTGDIVKRLPDGNIVFVERKDWMVNINGQRVEPAEITAVLLSMPQIVQAVVKDFQGTDGQTFLCGYYKLTTPVSEEVIREHLCSKLPNYMVPSYLMRMDAMPLNHHGKIDRSKLPDPTKVETPAKEPSKNTHPDNLLVKGIREELEKSTGRGDYGYDDDLVRCGMSSLSMIRFTSGIMDRFGVNLKVTDMLSGCSIESIESNIISTMVEHVKNPVEPTTRTVKESYPLTSSQMGVYIDQCSDPGSLSYNLPSTMTFTKKDHAGKTAEDIARSLKTVIDAHYPLKSTIGPDKKGNPCMFPHVDAEVHVNTVKGDDAGYETAKKAFVRQFDLSKELYHVTIYETDDAFHCMMDFHRIMYDGSSGALFRKDLKDAVEGRPVRPETYTMYDVAEDENNTGEEKRNIAKGFFEDLLSGIDGNTYLKEDILKEGRSKGHLTIKCDKLDKDNVRRFVESQGVTENSFFQSVMGFVLARYNYTDESCYTTVHSGRDGGNTSRLVGMLVKTVPVVCRFTSSESPKDLIKRTHAQIMGSMNSSAYPFSEIAGHFGLNANTSFAYQAILEEDMFKDQLEIPDFRDRLLLQMYPTKDGYVLDATFDASIYSEKYIGCLTSAFTEAARGFLSCDTLGKVSMCNESELEMLDGFNKTEHPYDRSKTIVDMFRDSVARRPDHKALVFNDNEWTYRELDEVTDRLAAYIAGLGIGRDMFVGILTGRNDMGIVAATGTVKSGAGYQPLDPSYPVDRLEFMIQDSSTRLVIADRYIVEGNEELGKVVSGFGGKVLYTDEIASLPAGTVPKAPSPEDAAIILYTSGTTGKPKGCVIEHAQATAYIVYCKDRFLIDDDSRYAQYASFGFDAGFGDTFISLSLGITLYIIDDSIRTDIKAMEKFFNDNGITFGFMTTQVGRLFMESANVPTLKAFLTGGEKLVPVNPPAHVCMYDGYGPSETLCFVASHRIVDDRPMQPVGTPNYNTRFYIVDKNLNRVPAGSMGELCISGLQVTRGYLNRPDKNSECFVENPFTDEKDYRRMYRTGDVARILPDGNLDFVGRSDGQVKIRGFRIELGEVEKVIREYPGIVNATVQAFDAPGGGKFIAAYIVSPSKVDIDDLNSFIKQTKPPYMVPAVTMQIDEIPLNVNSKVDKRKLPKPQVGSGEVKPPVTEVQKRIFKIVSEVISSGSFGIDTDLFQAGLTSIGSIRLNVLLSDEFGIPFQSKDIKENPTVLKIEGFLGKTEETESYPVQDDYPLTKTQEGIYVECLSHPGTTLYNMPLALKMDDGLDLEKIKDSIVKAVDAHPYIMTSIFLNDDGEPRLKRTEPGIFRKEDIQTVEGESFESLKNTLVEPFDIMGPRLMRVKIIEADGLYLMVDMHHIIGDGTSVNIFVDTVSRIYYGETVEAEKFSGFEVSLKEAADRKGDALEKAGNYYDDLLSGYDRDFLPKGDVYHPDPSAPYTRNVTGKTGLADKAKVFCDNTGTSMNGLMCSAFGYTLSKYNGSNHSLFTTVYNGRNDSRTVYSMSMFVKTLPVLCNVADVTRTPVSLVKEVGNQLVDSMSNDLYSFSEISRELDVKADILFVYQGDEFAMDSFCGRPTEMMEMTLSGSKEPILFQVMKKGDRFAYCVDYDNTRFTQEFIGYLTTSFENAIEQFMSCKTLEEVCLTDDSTMELVAKVNDTDSAYDRTRTVVDDFVDIARKQPDHIAVVCEDENITYGELDRVSDHLAAFIHSKGIGKDEYVGILVHRSVDMVTAAEGVIKSGAAYQPLDPTYPEERLQFMLEDSRVRLLISDRSLLASVPGYKGDVLCLDEIPSICTGERPDVSMLRPSPEDAMIILYTSGTTGTPKGCVLEHRNLTAYLNWLRPEMKYGPDTRYASYASYGFDACMMDIHSSMTSGATMYIIPDWMRKDIAEIDKYCDLNGITQGFMTTQMGRMFMESTKTKSLRYFMAGGEALVPLDPPGWVDFYNIYGPTECTVNVTTYVVKDDSKLIPIGKPNSNVRIYIMDKNDRIVPVGSCGELCISGPQVFREYLNNPEKTAMTVVRNPYGDCPEHSRLYKTGDVVRLLPDGNFDYIGRRDGMVKVRGFRIELGEVEKAIRDHPAVKDATVSAFDDPAGGKSLAAYIVSDTGVDIQELKDFIKKTKPPYMVPAHFIHMDVIPMTTNGKVDRRKLPAPSFECDREGREPGNEMESALCTIYANVLGLKKVYADDDFFEIGGTSISASKLVMACMNAGFPVVFKNIFDNPSPEALAKFIVSQKDVQSATEEERKTVDAGPLAHNVIEELGGICSEDLHKVLLTGATGFLGSHVLMELLRKGTEEIVCLVRSGKNQKSSDRLKTVFMYYFGGMVDNAAFDRIKAVDSDITDPGLKDLLNDYEFDTIINCAAVVKHFAADDSIERVNVDGVKNLVSIAMERGCRLVQVSTESVAGESVNGSVQEGITLKENMLDIGQNLDNKYVHSKYMAEQAMIEKMPEGLRGKIIRVGNLMSRISDGEFQINSGTNSFMKQIKSYTKIGCFPVSDLDTETEFSPIDKVAEAIVILAGTQDKYTVFHCNNCHKVHMANVLDVLKKNKLPVEILEEGEFRNRFMDILADEARNEYISGLISYMGNAGETRRMVQTDESFSIKALYRLGFSWPIIGEEYMDRTFKSLKSLRFFR